ncbi:Fusaric acid resistance protein-like [Microbacterium azadirachtae]|uniref:Fusaric acid resistance protein-like n=1 Tax=Microbacterium azadirachtae TaxID=582680 RepID=A0A1I6IZW4_9MICO|nr:Fusaric acid resistance protein-like [Microbacterium azadirachtae]
MSSVTSGGSAARAEDPGHAGSDEPVDDGGHLRVWFRSLVTLAPAPSPRWSIALQAALSMFLPLGLFTALGRSDLGLQAAGGAFVATYLTAVAPAARARALPVLGVALVACAAAGVALAPFPLLAALGLVVVTLVIAVLHFGFRLGAPGPVFFVLAYGIATHVTAVVDGRRHADPVLFLVALTTGVAITCATAGVFVLVRRVVRPGSERIGQSIERRFALGPDSRALLVRVVVVAAIGTLLSLLLVDAERAYWAVCAGVAVIGVNAGRRVAFIRGSQRLVGTVVGAGLFAALAALPLPGFALPVLFGALQFGAELFVIRNYALALVFITPLVLLLIVSTSPAGGAGTPGALIAERVVDTLVGATLGALSGFVHPRAYARRG